MSIDISNLSFSYDGKKTILNNLDLTINDSFITALMGLSGSGKTTLLRILLGLETTYSGRVSFDKLNTKPDISYIPQSGALFPHLSNYENVIMPIKIKNKVSKKTQDELDNLCHICNIPISLLSKFPHDISGGQRQRISILRALLQNNKYIFMDEPFSALDPITKRKMLDEFRNIFKSQNKTVILVTHSVLEAKHFCDDLVLLNLGRVISSGSTPSIIDNPQDSFTKDFINSQFI